MQSFSTKVLGPDKGDKSCNQDKCVHEIAFQEETISNLLTPIKGISPARQDKCVDEIAFQEEAISNLLKGGDTWQFADVKIAS